MTKITFRTPVQVFRKWIKELRSGNYNQSAGQLRECEYNESSVGKYGNWKVKKVVGFCCLGVLADIAAKDGGMKWGESFGGRALYDDDGEPPRVILNYLGLTGGMVGRLIDMNDEEGASFDEIADKIEFDIMPACGMK